MKYYQWYKYKHKVTDFIIWNNLFYLILFFLLPNKLSQMRKTWIFDWKHKKQKSCLQLKTSLNFTPSKAQYHVAGSIQQGGFIWEYS